jgi:pectate lyase
MPKLQKLLMCSLLLASLPVLAASPDESALRALSADGWASVEGGTQGGAKADASSVFKVRDIDGLLAAFRRGGNSPKIIVVEGVIDATGGKPFVDKKDQSLRTLVKIPSNTTLVGADKDAGFVNANLMLKGVENVIIRNLKIQNPWDEFPVWDPTDGPAGHWNSDYDGISIDNGVHIWIDHVGFTDAPRTDDQNGQANGQEVQHHDGAVDIKNGADFITISNCVFASHDKNDLIGHSDKNGKKDAGHLRITFHDNLFQDVIQRAPRVRFGQVHLYNNDYVGSMSHPVYPYMYSFGLGVESSLISEGNVFEIKGAGSLCDVVKAYGGNRFSDAGSQLNGTPLRMEPECKAGKAMVIFAAPGWTPPYAYAPKPAAEVAAAVKASAGPQ